MTALLLVLAIATLGVALLVRSDRLSRNVLVGLRTRTTLASDAAWRYAHRVWLPWMVTAGVVSLVGAGLRLGGVTSEPMAWILAGGSLAIVLLGSRVAIVRTRQELAGAPRGPRIR